MFVRRNSGYAQFQCDWCGGGASSQSLDFIAQVMVNHNKCSEDQTLPLFALDLDVLVYDESESL